MTPKEKGYELVKKYFNEFVKFYKIDTHIKPKTISLFEEIKFYKIDTHIKPKTISIFEENEAFSKQLALIAVDEIINANPHSNPMNTNVFSTMAYWQEVKQEIEKL